MLGNVQMGHVTICVPAESLALPPTGAALRGGAVTVWWELHLVWDG